MAVEKSKDRLEVLARIEVVLRRLRESKNEEDDLTFKSLTVSQKNNTVSCNGKELKLTLKEMQLLILFMKNPKKTFSKANLYEAVWEDDYIYEDNTINVHISNLRSKLKKAAGEDIIETVWGIGYRLKQEGK
jgi:DNA-binding response OmpR family regulator